MMMVIENIHKPSITPQLNIRRLANLPVRRLRSKAAVGAAVRLARRLAEGVGAGDGVDEKELFTALQLCAYHATKQCPSTHAAVEARREWANRWKLIRDYVVEQNLGLTYTMGNRFRSRDVEWDDVRSESHYALVRAVEGFNPWLGFKFSTYACNAIRRALIHLNRKATQYRMRFPMDHEPWLEQPDRVDTGSELYVERLSHVLDENLAELTDREVSVLDWRFPRDGESGRTLGEVGEAIGLSKERVRQIQKSALSKLRGVLEGDPVLQ